MLHESPFEYLDVREKQKLSRALLLAPVFWKKQLTHAGIVVVECREENFRKRIERRRRYLVSSSYNWSWSIWIHRIIFVECQEKTLEKGLKEGKIFCFFYRWSWSIWIHRIVVLNVEEKTLEKGLKEGEDISSYHQSWSIWIHRIVVVECRGEIRAGNIQETRGTAFVVYEDILTQKMPVILWVVSMFVIVI